MATTADNVVEGQEVECSPEIQEFQTAAFTDLGVDPASLTPYEIALLESAFREAYNLLSFSACDGFFRIVGKFPKLYSTSLISSFVPKVFTCAPFQPTSRSLLRLWRVSLPGCGREGEGCRG